MSAHNEKNPDYFKALEAWKNFADNIEDGADLNNVTSLQKEDATKNQVIDTNKKQEVSIEDLDEARNKKERKEDSSVLDEANDNFNINSMLTNIMDALKNEGKLKPQPKEQKKVYQPIEKIAKSSIDSQLIRPNYASLEKDKKDSRRIDISSSEKNDSKTMNAISDLKLFTQSPPANEIEKIQFEKDEAKKTETKGVAHSLKNIISHDNKVSSQGTIGNVIQKAVESENAHESGTHHSKSSSIVSPLFIQENHQIDSKKNAQRIETENLNHDIRALTEAFESKIKSDNDRFSPSKKNEQSKPSIEISKINEEKKLEIQTKLDDHDFKKKQNWVKESPTKLSNKNEISSQSNADSNNTHILKLPQKDKEEVVDNRLSVRSEKITDSGIKSPDRKSNIQPSARDSVNSVQVKPKEYKDRKDKNLKIDFKPHSELKDMALDASPILRNRDEPNFHDQMNISREEEKSPKRVGQGDIDALTKQLDKLNQEDSNTLVERRNLLNTGDSKVRPMSPNDQFFDSLSQYQLEIRSDDKMISNRPSLNKIHPENLLDESDYIEVNEIEEKFEDELVQLSFSYEISRDLSEVEELENERLIDNETRRNFQEEENDTPVNNVLIKVYLWFIKQSMKLLAFYNKIKAPDYTIDTFFARNCTFCAGRFKITKDHLFTLIILTGCMLYFLIDTSGTNSLSRVQKDPERQFVADLLVPGALIFTYYGMIFLYIPDLLSKILLVAELIPATLLAIIDLFILALGSKSDFSYKRIYLCGFIIFLNIFWASCRAIRKAMMDQNWKMAMVFTLGWCILLPLSLFSYTVYYMISPKRYDTSWMNTLIVHIGIPVILLLCLIWVYYHFKYFVPIAKRRETIKKSLSNRNPDDHKELAERFANVSHESLKEDSPEEIPPLKVRIYVTITGFIKKISSSVIIFSSFLIGSFLIMTECILLGYLSTLTLNSKIVSMEAFYLAIFLFFFFPIFVLAGIPIISANKNHFSRMFYIPLCSIAVPLFITMPLAKYLKGIENSEIVGYYFTYAPSALIVFWLTIYYLGIKRRKTKYALIPIIYICFMVPLIYLQPIINHNGYQSNSLPQGFSIFLIVIGVILIAVAIAYFVSRALLTKEISLKDRLNTDNYRLIAIFKADLEAFGYWINAVGFVVCFSISLYSVFQSPEGSKNSLKGIALGLGFTFILFFIYNNIALRLHTLPEPNKKNRLITISEAIIQSVHDNELATELTTIKKVDRRLRILTRFFTIIIIVSSIFVAAIGTSYSIYVSSAATTLAIGIFVVQIFFETFSILKVKKGTMAKSIVPALIAYTWCVQLLTLGSILHAARVFYYISPDDDGKRTRIEVLLVVLVFVITVSLLAIIANIIFKGIELAQKIRYILAYLKKKMEEIAVKSDFYVLEKIFDGWMSNGERKLRSTMLNRGRPVFWWPIPATNPIEKYSKVLLDFDAYKNLKLRVKKKNDGNADVPKDKAKKRNCLPNFCLKCLEYCFPPDETQKPSLDLQEEIDELADIDMNEVPLVPKGDDEESDSDDELDIGIELGDYQIETQIAENRKIISDIKFEPLDPRIYWAMAYYDKGIKFSYHDKETVDFLKMVFRTFAVGQYKFFRRRWLDYHGYKRLLILSGVIPSPDFPDHMIDLTYTLYTHAVGKGEIQRRVDFSKKKNANQKKKERKNKEEEERDNKSRLKIFPIFEEDFEGFLIHIAKIKYPNEVSDREALFRFIKWDLFTNYLNLLEKFEKEFPHEFDYLLYLKDLYMGKGRNKRPEDEGEDGIKEDVTENQTEGNINIKSKKGRNGTEGENGMDDITNQLSPSNQDLENMIPKKHYPCFQRFMIGLCRLLLSCRNGLLKKLAELLMALFFLKTNAQKKAEEEFDNQQMKDELEEREELKKKRADKINQENLGDNPELLEEELNKQGKFRRKARTYPHKVSPDWPVIVQTLIQSLKDAENDYENRKAADKKTYFIPNIRNYLTIFALFFEIYALSSLAFRKEIPWGWSSIIQTVLSFPSGSFHDFFARFWSAFGFSIFYAYLGYVSIDFAKESLLGADKLTMKAGEFPSRGLAHSQILIYTSTAMSVWIIKTLLDLFSCDYTERPWVLYSNANMECYDGMHNTVMGLGALCVFLYYPLSSFLYPNLQYLNKGNDFKHDTSFVVVFNQVKLIIITLHVYFPFQSELPIPLIGSAILFIGVALLCNMLKPCVVVNFNLWETAAFFIGSWINLVALVAYFTENSVLSTSLLLIGIFVILLIGLIVYKKKSKQEKSGNEPKKSYTLQESDRNKLDEKEIQNLLDVTQDKNLNQEKVNPDIDLEKNHPEEFNNKENQFKEGN